MSSETGDDREWAIEKREFVADARDEAGDVRDAAADARDSVADAREGRLEEWEKRLDASAGGSVAQGPLGTDSQSAETSRLGEREDRRELASARQAGKAARDQAISRRLAGGQPTRLAHAFANIAEHLYESDSYEEVLTRIAEAAVATLVNADGASVTILDANSYRSVGPTTESANQVDRAQYEAAEGPWLDAASNSQMVAAPAFPDERWPVLGTAPKNHGVESSLSYPLKGTPSQTGIGSLNIYAVTPGAFDEAAVEIGSILAAHASLAARAVGERTSLEQLDRRLQQALLSRDVIGQAKGILMERLKSTPDEAFEMLKNSSQRLNLKLREVARKLADTGELPSNRHRADQDRTEAAPIGSPRPPA